MEDEISEFQGELPIEKGRHNNQKDLDDEESQQQQNKGWMSNLHRESRVGQMDFQAQIPDLLYQNENQRVKVFAKHKSIYEPYINERQTYTYRHNLSDYEVKEYLNFAKCISLKDNKSDNEGLLVGLPSSDQVEANALNFLAKCDYSVIKAKFYLLFPTLMYFNAYKSKMQKPLKLSEQEMQEKIEQFVSQLQETKLGQHEKWKQELNELLENRNPIAKIHQHLEAGKLLRYEMPDYIKEAFDKANKFSKELKKVISERGTLERLEQLNTTALQEHKIITNEILQFEQSLLRCRDWLDRVNPHYDDPDKINLKILSGFINEYKSLPIKCEKFEKRFKNVYEQSLELIEKIPNFSRISKTRGTNMQERISIKEAIKILTEIQSLNVICDEFDSFECALIINLEKINNLYMHLNDEKQVFTIDLLKQLQIEAAELHFQSNVQDQIQDLHSYYKLIEKIKKQINDPSKLTSILEEITKGKERGFSSLELDSLEQQIIKTIDWFKNFERLEVEKKNITEKKIYQNFKIDQNDYKKVQLLEDMKIQSEQLKIDEASLEEFTKILEEIQNWRDHWNKIKTNKNNIEKTNSSDETTQNKIIEKMDIEEGGKKEKVETNNFDELLKFIQKGLTYGIQTPELLESIEYYRRGISWTISSLSYINEYFGNSIKSDLLPDNIFSSLSDIFNKCKYENELNTKNKQNYEKLDIYLEFQRIPPFCYQSKQYNYLCQLKNEVKLSEQESQRIIDLDLEELQSLDYFEVVDTIPKLDEKQKKLPINNHNNKKLWQIYVLQKWGKEAQIAHKFINEEFKENRHLQELLKKEGIVEFSQIVDQLAQKLPNSDLQEFIDCCKQHWTQIDQKFSQFLEIIQKNPIQENQILVESSQNSDQWSFQRIKTLLKNGSNFNLKNDFLKLYQDIAQYIEQIDNWIDNFYTKTICKRTIITKDGKKITKKKGLNLDDFNLSPLLEKKSSVIENLPENTISRQNSINNGNPEIDRMDIHLNSTKKQSTEQKADIEQDKYQNENGNQQNNASKEKSDKIEEENQEDTEFDQNNFLSEKKERIDTLNEDKIEFQNNNNYKNTPQKQSISVMKDEIQEPDTNKEDESNMNEEKLENDLMKASASKINSKVAKIADDQESKLSKEADKKFLKKSKINTFNYYLSYPMILITFYQGLTRDINNQEMIMAQNKMLELIKYKIKASELLKRKPTLEEMKYYIVRGEMFNCYIPELSIMKKINKWANQWISMARKILSSISKNKKNLNNTKVKGKDVLPIDFCEEKYTLVFDPNTLCVTITPRKKTDLNSAQQKSMDNKKKNDSGFFDGDLESQINFLNSNINNTEQIQKVPQKNQSQQNHSQQQKPGRKIQQTAFKPTGKRKLSDRERGNRQSGGQQSSYRPKRNTQIPKHYLQGQYHFDTPKLNPDQSMSPSSSQIIQNTKITPLKQKKKDIILEKVKRKYVRKNQTNQVMESPLKKKRIIGRDGIKTIVIEDARGDSSDKKLQKKQQKQVDLLEASGIGEEVQQQIAQISQMHQHSHIQVIEEDENRAYCICRGYSGEESIGCDGCQDWFHFSCIGLKPQLGNVLKKYYCMGCCKRFNRPYLAGHKTEYIWDTSEKISVDQFNEIVKEGLSLPLQIKEIDQILELKQKVDEQLQEIKTLIERGPDLLKIIELYEKAYKTENDYQGEQIEELRRQEEEKDRQLFQCYLAHFGFPIDFTQADQLLLLIQRRDFARQILRHLYSNKLSLIELFFNQVSKLFDLNKILIESSQDQFLFNHLKKIYDNSIDVKNKLSQLSKTVSDIEQYKMLFLQIEKEQLIIPNLKEYKIIIEDYQNWNNQAEKLQNSLNKMSKQQLQDELRILIDRYDSHILINSKQIQILRNIQTQLSQESQNQQYQINQNSFNPSTKNNLPPPPPYNGQIPNGNQAQYLREFNVDNQGARNGYHLNLQPPQENANPNFGSNEEDDDDQIKSFVEDSDEEYGEDFEDDADGINNSINKNYSQSGQQNGNHLENSSKNAQMSEEDYNSSDDELQENENNEEDDEEEEEDEDDEEQEEDEEEEEDDELEQQQQQQAGLGQGEDELLEDDEDEEEEEEDDEEEDDENVDEDNQDEEEQNYVDANNQNNNNDEDNEEEIEEEDEEIDEEDQDGEDEEDEDEIEDDDEEEEEMDEEDEDQQQNNETILNKNDQNNLDPLNIDSQNKEGQKINNENNNSNISNSTSFNKYKDNFLSPSQKPINFNGRSENNLELSHSPNNNGQNRFIGEDYLPNSLNVSPNISGGINIVENQNINNIQ